MPKELEFDVSYVKMYAMENKTIDNFCLSLIAPYAGMHGFAPLEEQVFIAVTLLGIIVSNGLVPSSIVCAWMRVIVRNPFGGSLTGTMYKVNRTC